MNPGQRSVPWVLVFAAIFLGLCLIFAIIIVDVLKLTSPDVGRHSPSQGIFASGNELPDTKCRTVSFVQSVKIPSGDGEVLREITAINFTDSRLPVFAEKRYLLDYGETYIITTEKRPDGKTYLLKASYGCEQTKKTNPQPRLRQEMPRSLPLVPLFLAGLFILALF